MLINYLKIAFRNLMKAKLLSFINIFGLALGIGSTILLALFVIDEVSFDTFYSRSDRIYRVWTVGKQGPRESINTSSPFSMGKQLAENYEEIEKHTVLTSYNDEVEKDGISFNENINIASPDFFEIFDLKVLGGSSEQAFADPKNVVITQEMAEKYFGSTDIIGSTMVIGVGGQQVDFAVKAVIENVPGNSSIQFDILISDHYLKDIFPERMLTSWFMITGESYVLLADGVSPETAESKFSSLVEQVLGERLENMEYEIHLQPLTDIHLNTELPAANATVSDPKYITILSGIAILILVIAGINFISLSLGRSLSRAKEIGIRKSIGAGKQQLIYQFIGEALVISLLATILGAFLAIMGLPIFNELSGKSLQIQFSVQNIILLGGIGIFVGVVAGIYPAFIMAGFNTVKILKGKVEVGSGKQRLRMVLVTGQFALSIFLITTTLIMKQQLSYLQNKNLGYDQENVVTIPISVPESRGLRDVVSNGITKARKLQQYLEGNPNIISSAISSHTFEPGSWTQIGWMDEQENRYNFYFNTVTENYIPTLGIEMVAGRNFSKSNAADERRSIIVNEAFVKEFNLENPIGARLPGEEFDDNEIIGVVRDFHIQSLHVKIAPLVLARNVNLGFSGAHSVNVGSDASPKLAVRIAAGKTQEAIASIQDKWNEVYSGEPFDYQFIDENLKNQYTSEANLGKIISGATILAVFIGCLGLFGLSTLTMTSRLREVSIRKVLGASVKNLLLSLNKGFVILIILSIVVASPFTYYAMSEWLAAFEYKIEISPIIFLLAGAIAMMVSLLTVSYQSLRAIHTNPAQVLRME